MKKLLTTIVLILLIGYIALATISFCNKPIEQMCAGIQLEIRDSVDASYIHTHDIVDLLSRKGLNPTGQALNDVSLQAMEEALDASPLIATNECYKTLDGHIMIKVKCRRPILRIITDSNESYFLDEEGEVIEHITQAVYTPIATGHITRKFAEKELFALAKYLQEEDLWNAQIEQIHVTPREEIELIPRIGNHIIVLGRPGDYADKFDKLKAFYKKGLSEVGWERYSHINIDYTDQVVATKR